MPNDLTPARLRELIAAATPGPWEHKIDTSWPTMDRIIDAPSQVIIRDEDCYRHYKCNRGDDRNFDLIVYLVNHAPALADALEKAELLEWALDEGLVSQMQRDEWGDWIERSIVSIDALRAAKEAANEVEN